MLVLGHTPCKSGSPHGVLVCFHVLDAVAVLAAGCCARAVTTDVVNTANAINQFRFKVPRFPLLLSELAVKQFLHEGDTFEFQQLETLFDTPVERQTHFPGPSEDLGIFQCCLVGDMVRV